jgi:hypothetical protein
MVVEPGQNRDGDNDTGPLHRPTQGRVLAQVRPQRAAWKRVLREAAATPNTKRTQPVRGVWD